MKKIMDKTVEIINSFDEVEEVDIWKNKEGEFYMTIYFPEDKNTKKAKLQLFKYEADKMQFEFKKEKYV